MLGYHVKTKINYIQIKILINDKMSHSSKIKILIFFTILSLLVRKNQYFLFSFFKNDFFFLHYILTSNKKESIIFILVLQEWKILSFFSFLHYIFTLNEKESIIFIFVLQEWKTHPFHFLYDFPTSSEIKKNFKFLSLIRFSRHFIKIFVEFFYFIVSSRDIMFK